MCNGILRSKYELPLNNPKGYYYISNHVVKPHSAFTKVIKDCDLETESEAYLDQSSSNNDIFIKLNVNSTNDATNPETWYLYHNVEVNGNCGGDSFTYNISNGNEDYYKWRLVNPNIPF